MLRGINKVSEYLDKEALSIGVIGSGKLPLYRHGDHLIVAPKANISLGDRVIVKPTEAALSGGTLVDCDHESITISGTKANPGKTKIKIKDVELFARIMWASQ